jgi:hypothetical protein
LLGKNNLAYWFIRELQRKKFYNIGPGVVATKLSLADIGTKYASFLRLSNGATTLSITTLSIKTLCITTLSIKTLCITTLIIMTFSTIIN